MLPIEPKTEPRELPKTEMEVVQRMTNKPVRLKLTATQDADGGGTRHWVELTFDFDGKLKHFGKWLYEIACDVDQAGGVVTKIDLGTGMNTNNDRVDDRNPHGKWRAMHVGISIRTKLENEAQAKAWDEAVQDIFRRGCK